MAGNEGMKKLISVVNRLQDAFSYNGLPFGLQLPQIAVVGAQSAGKSSVLENFVGCDFLPRGSGIVTRCPLVLQLNTSPGEYAEFHHMPGKRFSSFDDVRREIEAETKRGAGINKGISAKPINLKIYSPHVLNVTLVDLPGMTRVPVEDQPADIDKQIRDMVKNFIKQKNTLILAVSPANCDLANSDAMRVAQEVDPNGERTIGVITKLDLMDEGTNAKNVLRGEVLYLKRGYVGVVNRSQKDIDDNKSITEAIRAEKDFFRNHDAYRDMADRQGTLYLQQVLNRELGRHIKDTLPNIKRELRAKMFDVSKELEQLPDISNRDSMTATLIDYVTKFFQKVTTDIEGSNSNVSTNWLAGGAKINRMYYNECADELTNYKSVTDDEIAITIQNVHGIRNGLFTPGEAIERCVKIIIEEYKTPVKTCVGMVAELLKTIIDEASQVIQHDLLREEVKFQVERHILEAESNTKVQLSTYVDAELAFMNTRHHDFKWSPNHPEAESVQPENYYTEERRNISKEYVIKGHMKLHMKGFFGSTAFQDAWFTLTHEEFTGYTDDKESEELFTIKMVSQLKIRQSGQKFIFFRSDGKHVTKNKKRVEITCDNEQERERWSNAFTTCIDFPVMLQFDNNFDNKMDPDNISVSSESSITTSVYQMPTEMEREVAMIKPNIKSYVQIIGKNIKDIVPKYITLLLVEATKSFVTTKLMEKIITENKKIEDLMTDDTGETNRREDLLRAKRAAEEALDIIKDADTAV